MAKQPIQPSKFKKQVAHTGYKKRTIYLGVHQYEKQFKESFVDEIVSMSKELINTADKMLKSNIKK